MKLFIITVNYNSAEDTIGLLKTLENQTDQDFDIIVVDNASKDVNILENHISAQKRVFLLKNEENSGFSGGNNKGIELALKNGSNWVILLNPDTRPENNFISLIKPILSESEGIVGIPVDEGEKVAYCGKIMWLKYPGPHYHLYNPLKAKQQKMKYAVGAAMAISKETFEKIGFFDEKYFLYFEDNDFSTRAIKNSIPVSIAEKINIKHGVSSSTKKLGSPLLLRYQYRNDFYFNAKNGSVIIQILVFPWSILVMLKQFIKILFKKNTKESWAILNGIFDFYSGRMGKIVQQQEDNRIRIGIECENIEDKSSRWGVGRIILNLVEEYSQNKELQDKYQLVLFFKTRIPDDEFLKNPIFEKRIVGSISGSFNIYYHIFLPITATLSKLDWMFFPAYMLPPLYLGKSVVMLTNDVYYEYKSGNLPFRYRLAYRLFTNWAAKKAKKILAISEYSKKEISKLYNININKIFVSHLGVKTDTTTKENKYGDYILFIAQMFPRRRAKETILAFKKIAPKFPNLKLVLVGKDKYNPPIIKDLIKKTGSEIGENKIVYYDYIEDDSEIRNLYHHAKLFVYVSSSEAFGLPPVEAASCGVPVVVSDSELSHELFEDAGFFVKNVSDIDELAEMMERAITDNEKINYCKNKYKEIMPKLNWKAFTEKFFQNLNA